MLGDTNIDPVAQTATNPGGPFFPDLDIDEWQEVRRIAGNAPATLERQLLLAMADTNAKLAVWRASQEAAGGTALPATNLLDYTEAVQSRAMGLLLSVLPSEALDSRSREHLEALKLEPRDYFTRADKCISRIAGARIGSGRIRVRVI